MKITAIVRGVIGCALVLGIAGGIAGCGGAMSGAKGAMSLYEQVGGMDQINSLTDKFMANVSSDSRTKSLLANADQASVKSKLSNQLCSMTGGGCAAPLTDSQIAAGAKKVDPATTSALNDSLSKAVGSMSSSSVVKDTLTKAIGPKLGGIVGGLL